jgi:pyruvate kinase
MVNEKFTKIVATIGPSSKSTDIIKDLIIEGVDVFRLNFSHGKIEEHLDVLKNIRKASDEVGKFTGVFQDLQGPKIRIREIENQLLELKEKETLIITTEILKGGIINGEKR